MHSLLAEPTSRRSVILFWALLLFGVGAVGGLSLALRAPTLGGSTVEFREYLQPSLSLRGLQSSLDILGGWHPWLLPVAVMGLPLARGGWRGLVAGRGITACLLMVLVVIAFNSFGLVRRGESRYILAALPFLAVVAAVALDRVGPSVVAALSGQRRLGRGRHLTRMILLTLLVAVSLDPTRLIADVQSHAVPSTWVQAMADRGPDDVIVSFAPTLTSYYLGRTDFWVRTEGYSKYIWSGRTPLRDVHTGAVLVRNQTEWERLVLEPNRGRTVWVILSGDPSTEVSRLMRDLDQQIIAVAAETRRPPDGRLVLKLQP
jgi:hypothetical protein